MCVNIQMPTSGFLYKTYKKIFSTLVIYESFSTVFVTAKTLSKEEEK